MHLQKLNQWGSAHIIAPLLVVVGIAVVGSYMLVASHAATCPPVSSPVSAPTSAPVSGPVYCPVSSPTSSPYLVKGGPCFLGTKDSAGHIQVLNPAAPKGDCGIYSNGQVFYSGKSGTHIKCRLTTTMHNKVPVCVKVT